MVNEHIKELIEKFVNYHKRLGRTAETLSAYESELLFLFNHLETNVLEKQKYMLNQITYADIDTLLKYCQGIGNSSVTIARKTSVLKSFFNYIFLYFSKQEKLKENIMNKIEIPKLETIIHLIPDDSMRDLYFECIDTREYVNEFQKLCFQLFAYLKWSACARTIEMVRIEVGDIDFDKKLLILRGKGNKQRRVSITEKAKELIMKFIKIAELEKKDKLIRSVHNRPITKRALELRHKKILDEAGIPSNFTLHPMLRKKPATELYFKLRKKGMGLAEVQDYLGHADPKTTRIYVESAMNVMLDEFTDDHPLEM